MFVLLAHKIQQHLRQMQEHQNYQFTHRCKKQMENDNDSHFNEMKE